jgi:hypothetical protein
LESKSLTHARGVGGGVRDTSLAARSTLAAIKVGKLGHYEKGEFTTVLVGSLDWLIN